MLTDSNEDSLLARIEKRGEEGMVLHYTSQDLLSKPLCTHMCSQRYKQHKQHTHKNTCLMCFWQPGEKASLFCITSVLFLKGSKNTKRLVSIQKMRFVTAAAALWLSVHSLGNSCVFLFFFWKDLRKCVFIHIKIACSCFFSSNRSARNPGNSLISFVCLPVVVVFPVFCFFLT